MKPRVQDGIHTADKADKAVKGKAVKADKADKAVKAFSATRSEFLCHLERSEAPAERSRKTPVLFGSHQKQKCISTTGRQADRRNSRASQSFLPTLR
ncbi:MAG: hypothetical protein DMG82_01095 [Acidobacteria bacterium]|nr:MAG: hypothetical protein DMG82_01095 [Acidobacteriota bacterium]